MAPSNASHLPLLHISTCRGAMQAYLHGQCCVESRPLNSHSLPSKMIGISNIHVAVLAACKKVYRRYVLSACMPMAALNHAPEKGKDLCRCPAAQDTQCSETDRRRTCTAAGLHPGPGMPEDTVGRGRSCSQHLPCTAGRLGTWRCTPRRTLYHGF